MHKTITVQFGEEISILFVEDSADDYEIIKHLAGKIGENIFMERASTGTEALKKLMGRDYDMILLDYRLPDMDGLEFMQKTEGLDIPILFLTGMGNEKVAVEAVKRGACDYIRKEDINEGTLASIIKSNRRLIGANRNRRNIGDGFRERKRRDSFSITMSILSHAARGIGKTQLVYRTNLNFRTMDRYLCFLMKNGFVSSYMLDGSKYYRTTEKGVSFLEELRKIENFLL